MADNYHFQIEARVDIAIYPANSINPAQLVQMANKALYEVREFGRNTYRCDAHHSGPEKPVYGHTLAIQI